MGNKIKIHFAVVLLIGIMFLATMTKLSAQSFNIVNHETPNQSVEVADADFSLTASRYKNSGGNYDP